jgi:DNA uptake protein ComE-like DNA-binding protein
MNRLRAWIRSFFGFSRTETNAFLVFIPLMILLICSEPLYEYWFVHQPLDYSKETSELDSLVALMKWSKPDSLVEESSPAPILTLFNPNEASKEQLLSLGFNTALAARLINYRTKGGKFRVKHDVKKIYGMDSLFYLKIEKYIDLPTQRIHSPSPSITETKPKPTLAKFDLNTADTAQLIKIYGIGAKLSMRIVAYRQKLGGFVSLQQVNEVYALDSVAIKELTSRSFIDPDFHPTQIDLNKATEKELAAHPYIKFKLAKAIAAYRLQHGPFRSVEELKEIVIIDALKFQQIKPYLSVNP